MKIFFFPSLGPLLVFVAAMLLIGGDAVAQTNGTVPAPSSVAGTVTHLSGVLTAKSSTGASRVLAVKSEVMQGDTLVTEQNTYARVRFSDDAEVVLRPGSELVVASYVYDLIAPAHDNVVLNLLKGGLRAVTGLIGKRNHDAVTVNTPTATIGIRGTHFGVLFCQSDCGGVPTANGQTPANGLHVDVAKGAIIVTNTGGSLVFGAGQFGYVPDMNRPPMMVPPGQGVQMKMPESISRNNSSSQTIGAERVNACLAQ